MPLEKLNIQNATPDMARAVAKMANLANQGYRFPGAITIDKDNNIDIPAYDPKTTSQEEIDGALETDDIDIDEFLSQFSAPEEQEAPDKIPDAQGGEPPTAEASVPGPEEAMLPRTDPRVEDLQRRIRELAAGRTQDEIAAVMGVGRSTVSRWTRVIPTRNLEDVERRIRTAEEAFRNAEREADAADTRKEVSGPSEGIPTTAARTTEPVNIPPVTAERMEDSDNIPPAEAAPEEQSETTPAAEGMPTTAAPESANDTHASDGMPVTNTRTEESKDTPPIPSATAAGSGSDGAQAVVPEVSEEDRAIIMNTARAAIDRQTGFARYLSMHAQLGKNIGEAEDEVAEDEVEKVKTSAKTPQGKELKAKEARETSKQAGLYLKDVSDRGLADAVARAEAMRKEITIEGLERRVKYMIRYQLEAAERNRNLEDSKVRIDEGYIRRLQEIEDRYFSEKDNIRALGEETEKPKTLGERFRSLFHKKQQPLTEQEQDRRQDQLDQWLGQALDRARVAYAMKLRETEMMIAENARLIKESVERSDALKHQIRVLEGLEKLEEEKQQEAVKQPEEKARAPKEPEKIKDLKKEIAGAKQEAAEEKKAAEQEKTIEEQRDHILQVNEATRIGITAYVCGKVPEALAREKERTKAYQEREEGKDVEIPKRYRITIRHEGREYSIDPIIYMQGHDLKKEIKEYGIECKPEVLEMIPDPKGTDKTPYSYKTDEGKWEYVQDEKTFVRYITPWKERFYPFITPDMSQATIDKMKAEYGLKDDFIPDEKTREQIRQDAEDHDVYMKGKTIDDPDRVEREAGGPPLNAKFTVADTAKDKDGSPETFLDGLGKFEKQYDKIIKIPEKIINIRNQIVGKVDKNVGMMIS